MEEEEEDLPATEHMNKKNNREKSFKRISINYYIAAELKITHPYPCQ